MLLPDALHELSKVHDVLLEEKEQQYANAVEKIALFIYAFRQQGKKDIDADVEIQNIVKNITMFKENKNDATRESLENSFGDLSAKVSAIIQMATTVVAK